MPSNAVRVRRCLLRTSGACRVKPNGGAVAELRAEQRVEAKKSGALLCRRRRRRLRDHRREERVRALRLLTLPRLRPLQRTRHQVHDRGQRLCRGARVHVREARAARDDVDRREGALLRDAGAGVVDEGTGEVPGPSGLRAQVPRSTTPPMQVHHPKPGTRLPRTGRAIHTQAPTAATASAPTAASAPAPPRTRPPQRSWGTGARGASRGAPDRSRPARPPTRGGVGRAGRRMCSEAGDGRRFSRVRTSALLSHSVTTCSAGRVDP